MSFVYAVLCDYKNYADDHNHEGRDLYLRLFKPDGLRSDWRDRYMEWLDDLCDQIDLPEGRFRMLWMKDALDEAKPEGGGDLDLIQRWFAPDDEEEHTCDGCQKPVGANWVEMTEGDDEVLCQKCACEEE